MIAIILFFLGILIGVFCSLLGIGGGILIVPCLYLLFPKISAQVVIGTSLAVIFFSNLGTLYYLFKNKIKGNIKLKVIMSILAFLGVYAGSHITFLLGQRDLKLILAITLIVFSIKIFFAQKNQVLQKNHHPQTTKKVFISCSICALFAGVLASLTGLGGGIIIMPVLISLGFSMIQAGQYSNLVIGIGSLSGLINYSLSQNSNFLFDSSVFNFFQIGYVNFLMVLLVFPGSLLGAYIGVRLSLKVSQRGLQIFLAVLQLAFAAHFLLFPS